MSSASALLCDFALNFILWLIDLIFQGNHLLFLEVFQYSYLQFLTNMLIFLIFLDLSIFRHNLLLISYYGRWGTTFYLSWLPHRNPPFFYYINIFIKSIIHIAIQKLCKFFHVLCYNHFCSPKHLPLLRVRICLIFSFISLFLVGSLKCSTQLTKCII